MELSIHGERSNKLRLTGKSDNMIDIAASLNRRIQQHHNNGAPVCFFRKIIAAFPHFHTNVSMEEIHHWNPNILPENPCQVFFILPKLVLAPTFSNLTHRQKRV